MTIEAAHKSVSNVWGILGVLGGCVALGFAAAAFFGNVAKKDTTDAIQRDVIELKRTGAVNQAVVETTLTTMRGDIQEIKEALRISKNPEPLTPEKKTERKPR